MVCPGTENDESVEAERDARAVGHAVFERGQKILVDRIGFSVERLLITTPFGRRPAPPQPGAKRCPPSPPAPGIECKEWSTARPIAAFR